MVDKIYKQPLLLKIVFSLIVLLVFVGAFESVLSFVNIDLYEKNQFFPINRDIDFPEVYKKDKNLFWRFRPNQTINSRAFSDITYKINSDGFRGVELSNNKVDIKILALGNSCTFGWGVAQNNVWTTLLEQQLQTSMPSKKIEVINAGVPGYSSFQGKNYFINELIEKIQPDIVLIMFGWNDQWPAGKNIADAEQKLPNSIVLGVQNKLSKMKMYQFWRKVILSTTEKQETVPLDKQAGKRRVSLVEFRENLQEIIRAAKANNITPILMVPPVASVENYFPGKTSRLHAQHYRYQNQIINTAKYENILVIDHQPIFNQYNDLYDNPNDDPIHFNIKGNYIFSKTILNNLFPVVNSL